MRDPESPSRSRRHRGGEREQRDRRGGSEDRERERRQWRDEEDRYSRRRSRSRSRSPKRRPRSRSPAGDGRRRRGDDDRDRDLGRPATAPETVTAPAASDAAERRRQKLEAWRKKQEATAVAAAPVPEAGAPHAAPPPPVPAAPAAAAPLALAGPPRPAAPPPDGDVGTGTSASVAAADRVAAELDRKAGADGARASREGEQDATPGDHGRGWNLEDDAGSSDDEVAAAGVEAGVGAPNLVVAEAARVAPPPPVRRMNGQDGPLLAGGGAAGRGPPVGGAGVPNGRGPVGAREGLASVAPASAPRAPAFPGPTTADGDDGVDPLDAFMAAEVLPEVARAEAASRPSSRANGSDTPALGDPPTRTPLPTRGQAGETASPTAGRPSPSPPPEASGAPAPRAARPPFSTARPPSRPGTARAPDPASRPPSAPSGPAEAEASSSESEADGEAASEDDETWARKVRSGQAGKGERLGQVDHSKIDYAPFRRDFYREPDALTRLTKEEVAALRQELDGIKVRGRAVPRPLRTWDQAGLSERVLTALRPRGFEAPLPIQAQALPAIMSGRDCLGIAKTGSGKTLAYVLPLLRHARDQRPLARGDGPIGLILAPTRELVAQIARETQPLAQAAGLRTLAVYGGSGVAAQIAALKRGVEIVVATPGRLIDILVTSGGRITNLRRITYLVLDEADRMFDLGFEPQISRIVRNVRPDRQTVLFSATFPRAVEALARQLLRDPVEILVGGRSVVNRDIEQLVEIRPEDERFLRLLEVLGEWYERGKILVFVNSQERCDALFRDLLRHGYPCLSLHGGKDQADRASTISDFKRGVCNVLVATSVAARGLDVRDLVLVVNYDVPNHLEEYVHRVGRTGRAGRTGTAITFLSPDEDEYAPDVARALREAGTAVPSDLADLARGFEAKRAAGKARAHGSGYGGSGYRFDAQEGEEARAERRAQAAARRGDGGDRAVDEDAPEPAPAPAPAAPSRAAAGLGHDGAGASGDVRAVGSLRPAPPGSRGAVENEEEILALRPEQRVVAVEAQKRARVLLDRLAGGEPAAPPLAVSASLGVGAAPAAVPAAAAASAVAAAAAAAAAVAARLAASRAAGSGLLPPGAGAGGLAPGLVAASGLVPAGASAATAAPPLAPRRHFETELEINDFPQHARWKVTHRDTIHDIEELGAAVMIKGRYVKPGERVPEGERKIYLHVQGPSEAVVRRAKAMIKDVLEESTERAMRREAPSQRYSVV